MGQPIKLDGSNVVMRAPDGAENVQDMHVFQTRHSCVSCWELSAVELAEINRSGRVFLSVLMGGQQPPVYVGSESACREVLIDFGPVWPMTTKPPARAIKWANDMTTAEIEAELATVTARIANGFGDSGGSPGEWWYERADELEAALKKRTSSNTKGQADE